MVIFGRFSAYSKSIAVALTGCLAWGNVVAISPSAGVTSREWMKLAAVGVAFALAWLVPNSPVAPKPDPAPPAEGIE